MAKVIETLVYSFDELNDEAKENARDWYRGCIESDEIASDSDDWESVATILGVTFDTNTVRLYGGGTRQERSIYWDLEPAHCAFDGWYAYAKGAPKAIRAYAPQDTELHRIADELQAVQRKAFYRLTARCSTTGRNGTELHVRHCGDNPSANAWSDEPAIADLLRDFAAWIASQIKAQRDYLYSEEAVDEMIRCNVHEFDESGHVA